MPEGLTREHLSDLGINDSEEVEESVLEKLKDFCRAYDLTFEHFVEVIQDPKVIPMIRGKSFEFSASERLSKILLEEDWEVKNPQLNPQLASKDVDVGVLRKEDEKEISVECKLAGKDSFKWENTLDGYRAEIKVKCMRSRTLGDNITATRTAKRYSIDREKVLLHKDSYRPDDFDFVVTSLGNSLWITEDEDYVFGGSKNEYEVLSDLFPDFFDEYEGVDNFQREAFNFFLIADSEKIAAKPSNDISCRRRDCKERGMDQECGFIPNYPYVDLKKVSDGESPWKVIDEAKDLFIEYD